MRRRLPACAVAFAAVTATGAARAQAWPVPDPWFTTPTPPGPDAMEASADPRAAVLARAEAALGSRQGSSVVALLTAELRRARLARGGYDAVAVLLRVARGELPATPARTATNAPAGLPPPPPSDREATERSIDGAVELLVRGDHRSAAAWLDSALSARPGVPDDHALRSLRRVAARLADGSNADPAPAAARGGRPDGTIDAAEAVTLIGLGGTYGLTLGVWSAVAIEQARGDSGVVQILVPMAGVAAGMVTAGVLDGERVVRRGRAYAANAGFYLGLLGAFGVDLLADSPLRDATPFERASAYLGAATVGIGAGIGVAHASDALPGSAAFTLSGGVWGALVGASFDRGFRNGAGAETPGAGLLAGGAAGAVAAMVTSRWLRPTPAQTRWLDLGALVGFLAGFLVAAKADEPQVTALASGLGCVAGGALGYVLGAPSTPTPSGGTGPVRASLRPTPTFQAVPGGGVFGVSL